MTTIAQQASPGASAPARGLVLAAFLAATAAHAAPSATTAPGYADRPEVTVFIDEVVADYG